MCWRFVVKISLLILSFVMTPAYSEENNFGNQNELVLEVSVPATEERTALVFGVTMAMLKALPETVYKTSTVWTEGLNEFKGARLVDLLAAIDARPKSVIAWAINGYMAEFDPTQEGWNEALIAYSVNGKPMQVREKGPLWIVFPYDDSPKFRSDYIYSHSVWQLNHIDVG